MPENVSSEEVEALVGEDTPDSRESVELRDFRQPRRLPAAQQQSLRNAITQVLPTIESGLTVWLRGDVSISLRGLGEASALGLFDELPEPFSLLTYDVAGVQGWVVWENEAALRSIFTILGVEAPEDLTSRQLSPMEVGLTMKILAVFQDQMGDVLGLDLVPEAYCQNRIEYFAQDAVDRGEDPQRLFVHLDVESSAGTSTFRFYLPGILPQTEESSIEPAGLLPNHLDSIPVELSVELGSVEVSLTDLMKIEVGDVITLDTPIGGDVLLRVEGNRAATGQWGQSGGKVAITLQELESISEESASHE